MEAQISRVERDEAGRPVRFVLNTKDWDNMAEEDKAVVRDHFWRVGMDLAFRPVKEQFGPVRCAAALRAVLEIWKAEREGKSEPVLTPLMEQGLPPLVVGAWSSPSLRRQMRRRQRIGSPENRRDT